MLFWIPIYGWVWPANIFVAIAPVFVRRIEQGKGDIGYVFGLSLGSIFSLSVPIAWSLGYMATSFRLAPGYYLWQVSLLATATWFWWIILRSRAVLFVSGFLMASFLASFLVVLPAYSMHKQAREALSNLQAAARQADDRIQAFEKSGLADVMLVPQVNGMQYLDTKSPGLKDFNLAMAYMGDIYACRDRERISDYIMMERYPGVPAHHPEPAHRPRANGAAYDGGSRCIVDASDKQPWMYYSDVQPAALARAKLYLRNSEIEMGVIQGQKQLPALLSSFELGHPNRLPTKDLPAHASKLEGIAEILKTPVTHVSVEAEALLPKGDLFQTGTYSKAQVSFADASTCTLGAATMISVTENSLNSAGRTDVEVRLLSGSVLIETGAIAWGSIMQ